jgi:hypothetical protein
MMKWRLAGLIGWGTALGAGLLSPALAVDLPTDRAVLSYPALRPTLQASSGVLLMSGSPETPTQSGLLYQDTLTAATGNAGPVRVMAYHANGLGRPARLLLLARNLSGQPIPINVLRQGSAVTFGPDPLIGQQMLLRYFSSGPRPARTLSPGEQVVMYDSGVLAPGRVASLLLDLNSGAGLQLTVVMIAQDGRTASVAADVAALPTLPRDIKHQRGTFLGANRTLQAEFPADVGTPLRWVLSGPDDPPLQGQDMLTGVPQILLGNYGVLYTLRVSGAAGRVLAASPRGGPYRGSLLLQDGFRSSQVLLGQGRALKDSAAPAALWSLRSPEFQLQIVPASGSSLPLALLFYPGKFFSSPR